MSRRRQSRPAAVLLLAALTACLLTATPAAAAAPRWQIDSLSRSAAEPGSSFTYTVDAENVGDADSAAPITLSATLPAGLSATEASLLKPGAAIYPCTAPGGGPIAGRQIECTATDPIAPRRILELTLTVALDAGAGGQVLAEFTVSGGDAAPATTVDPTQLGPSPGFGIDAFDLRLGTSAASLATAASSHPDSLSVSFDINSGSPPISKPALIGEPWPTEPLRDIHIELPPGLIGNPLATPRCSLAELVGDTIRNEIRSLCPPGAQIGTVSTRFKAIGGGDSFRGPIPLYNLEPGADVPARFGFGLNGSFIILDAELRSDGDYGLSVASRNLPEALAITGASAELWGTPADPAHDPERACPGERQPLEGGPTCPVEGGADLPLLRAPSACTPTPDTGLPATLRIDSWQHPGDFAASTIATHEDPGYPYPPTLWGPALGIAGCEQVPFQPSISIKPTTTAADSPSGLDVHLQIPQECWSDPAAVCSSDLADADGSLPTGMSANPAAASGLAACSAAQIGLLSAPGDLPRFDSAAPTCPNAAKLGELEISTPLLQAPLRGGVYLARQSQNPFGSLLALYLVAEGSGVRIKQAAEVSLAADFRPRISLPELPPLPFSALHLRIYGGPHAPLRTPPRCGTYFTHSTLIPASGFGAVGRSSSFAIETGPGGSPCPTGALDPGFSAGVLDPTAAHHSPLAMNLSRADGTEELAYLRVKLPPGLLARLRGVPRCPDAVLAAIPAAAGSAAPEVAEPSCPAASLIGTLSTDTGAGPDPFRVPGRVYLAGPHDGAPLSLATVVPALAGPLDLGNVVLRSALRIDPRSARISADSGPLPTDLHGIPTDLRRLHLQLDRPGFILNPTSCEPAAFAAQIGGVGGTSASRSAPFQVGGCDRLGFSPRLHLALTDATSRRGHPRLTGLLRTRRGDANAARARVSLPTTELIDSARVPTPCTRVQFAAAACAPGAILGHAEARTPLLARPLSGPIYFRSNGGARTLPDIAIDLRGQVHVVLVGHIDTHDGRIRNTFAALPDAPLTSFKLSFRSGRDGVFINNTDLCSRRLRIAALFDAHNGLFHEISPPLGTDCTGFTAPARPRR